MDRPDVGHGERDSSSDQVRLLEMLPSEFGSRRIFRVTGLRVIEADRDSSSIRKILDRRCADDEELSHGRWGLERPF